MVVIADRWYKSAGKACAYSLSFIPIEVISGKQIDLREKEDLFQYLEHGVYEDAVSSTCQLSYTTTGNFTAVKYMLSQHASFILVQETLYDEKQPGTGIQQALYTGGILQNPGQRCGRTRLKVRFHSSRLCLTANTASWVRSFSLSFFQQTGDVVAHRPLCQNSAPQSPCCPFPGNQPHDIPFPGRQIPRPCLAFVLPDAI